MQESLLRIKTQCTGASTGDLSVSMRQAGQSINLDVSVQHV